jgi:hypothetical protein
MNFGSVHNNLFHAALVHVNAVQLMPSYENAPVVADCGAAINKYLPSRFVFPPHIAFQFAEDGIVQEVHVAPLSVEYAAVVPVDDAVATQVPFVPPGIQASDAHVGPDGSAFVYVFQVIPSVLVYTFRVPEPINTKYPFAYSRSTHACVAGSVVDDQVAPLSSEYAADVVPVATAKNLPPGEPAVG